jgi:glycosyltransferase involved in cell wall biosynthesis
MRIVIDMQGAQASNRNRGIGRYTMAFAQAVVRNRGEHEIILALSGLFPDTIEPIRAAFDGLLPQENIRVWHAPGPVMEEQPGNESRREVAELLREAFLASLQPDVIHISSLFEGYVDDAVTSIGRFDQTTPVSVTLHVVDEPVEVGSARWQAFSERKRSYLEQACITLAADSTAEQAVDRWLEAKAGRFSLVGPTGAKPRLAFVSPLPPGRTGIADYSAELLPSLAAHYQIELIAAQPKVDHPWINRHVKVRDVAWLRAHAGEIDRVLYHVGNSPFHAHMLPLLEEIPGTVVLHDFYLGDLMSWLEAHLEQDAWRRELYEAHGYAVLTKSYSDAASAKFDYPANWHVLQHAQGIIVHSFYSRSLAQQWYGPHVAANCEVIPLLRAPAAELDKLAARSNLGIDASDFVVCSFGFLVQTKLNHRLLNAWLDSELSRDTRCHLFFVGENDGGDYGASLLKTIRDCGLSKRIHITGFASPEVFRQYLAAADLAVQLRTLSRGETSAAALDCMNHGLPLIVNANGSMAELDPQAVWMLPDEFSDAELIEALQSLWRDPERRRALGERARQIILERHAPDECARRYAEAIEHFHCRSATGLQALLHAIAEQNHQALDDAALLQLSQAIATTFPLAQPAKRLFLDITATCRNDLKTGIERVARALIMALIESPPVGYRIEPVYLAEVDGVWQHRFARNYTMTLMGCPMGSLPDDPIDPKSGDVLICLDISGNSLILAEQSGLFGFYRNLGIFVYSIVYDLLPIRMPEVFPPGADLSHAQWLRVVSTFDGAICISESVAVDLNSWLEETGKDWQGRRRYHVGWWHLGADVTNSAPSKGLPDDYASVLARLAARPSFLMVGTIEPRKGYLQTIEAFTQLWREGVDVNLVIVGKEGWTGLPDDMRRDIPQTVARLRSHPELNKRLYWLEGISDEYLEMIYAASTCLIAASYGEGFGLPLIEAAQHNLPIIARDIPVFREVAGDHAFYFEGKAPDALSRAVKKWLDLYAEGKHPASDTLPWIDWKQSARRLLEVLGLNPHSSVNQEKS